MRFSHHLADGRPVTRLAVALTPALAVLAAALPGQAAEPPVSSTPAALARVDDGAALVLLVRPDGAIRLLRRLGVDQSATVAQLRFRLGGDPLDSRFLAPTGLDTSASLALALFEPAPGGGYDHHRLAVQLSNSVSFSLLLAALSLSPELGLRLTEAGTPLAKRGVRATIVPPVKAGEQHAGAPLAIVRLGIMSGTEWLIVDLATSIRGRRPSALELATRYPLSPRRPFSARATPARRLLDDAAALAAFVDGRRLAALARPLLSLENSASGERAVGRCLAAWARVPATFDELALAAGETGGRIRVTLGWGESRLKPSFVLNAEDDGVIDAETLSAFALGTLSLRFPLLAPFRRLPRSGPLASPTALTQAFARCPTLTALALLVRHWPQAVGTLLGARTSAVEGVDLAGIVGELRNLHVLVRDFRGSEQRFALVATIEDQAWSRSEPLLRVLGEPRTATYGARRLVVYELASLEGMLAGANVKPGAGVIAVEHRPQGRALIAYADSRATLDWAYASPAQVEAAAPVLRLHLDGWRAARALRERAAPGASPWLDVLGRLGRIDARLENEGGLLRLRITTSEAQARPGSRP